MYFLKKLISEFQLKKAGYEISFKPNGSIGLKRLK
jgi:hypothetical protein